MIPKLLHFIYVGGRSFSFIHFLAIYTAWKVHRPECIYFHHTTVPSGIWWDRARPFVNMNRLAPVNEVHGNPIKYPAHMADVIRIAVLKKFGGIYLDLDIISINSFDRLLEHEFVMGMEPGAGLCNAVILSAPGANFLSSWDDEYRNFDGRKWNYHSVVLPWKLAQEHPDMIHVEDKYAFFYPTHNDPVHHYLWGQRPTLWALGARLSKNMIKLFSHISLGKIDGIKLAYYQTFHTLHGSKWHYLRVKKSYCLHLWEGLWGERYLKAVTPEYILHNKSHFARLLREILTEDELHDMNSPRLVLRQAHKYF